MFGEPYKMIWAETGDPIGKYFSYHFTFSPLSLFLDDIT